MSRFHTLYSEKIVPELTKKFGYKSIMEVPRITKITLNMGVGEAVNDKKVVDNAVGDMTKIAGQKPVITYTRKAIANFKIREGMPIGCMVTLRQMELHEGLSHYTEGAVKDAFRHIVGVQFRNLATVGGSLFGRFGFSDVLTLLLALDCDVELYKGGIMSIQEFAKLKRDNDILVHIVIKKTPVHICYQSVRNTVTDFPTLNLTAAIFADKMRISIGARPGKAMLFEDESGLLKGLTDGSVTEEVMHTFAKEIKEKLPTGSNMRGTAEYRSHLAEVMTVRALRILGGDRNAD